jgi:hypothetical protein
MNIRDQVKDLQKLAVQVEAHKKLIQAIVNNARLLLDEDVRADILAAALKISSDAETIESSLQEFGRLTVSGKKFVRQTVEK